MGWEGGGGSGLNEEMEMDLVDFPGAALPSLRSGCGAGGGVGVS